MALAREDEERGAIDRRCDQRKAQVVDEIDREQPHTSSEVLEVGRRQLLLTSPQPVERGQHPPEAIDASHDRDQQDQSHDRDLAQPFRVADRPDEGVRDPVHLAASRGAVRSWRREKTRARSPSLLRRSPCSRRRSPSRRSRWCARQDRLTTQRSGPARTCP